MVAKFKCSDHTLMIGTGRHKKIDLEERMCKCALKKGLKMRVISSYNAQLIIRYENHY